MTSKAILQGQQILLRDSNFPKSSSLKFTKSQILFPKTANNIIFPDSNIKHGVHYKLNVNENINRLYRYEITIGNSRPIKLGINRKNEIKLKWIHGKYWMQKAESNWFKQAMLAGLISIIGYFLGQSIGLRNGYQDGLKKAQEEYRKSHQLK